MKQEQFSEARPLDELGQVLMDAAKLIRVGGLCKGANSRGESYCTIGAIFATTSNTIQAFYAMRKLGMNDSGGIVAWNDATERTAEEVISALEAAALS